MVTKAIKFTPSKYDLRILTDIQAKHPHLASGTDLIREALRVYDIESMQNSKSAALARIEEKLDRALGGDF